jgi:hypothetical protein
LSFGISSKMIVLLLSVGFLLRVTVSSNNMTDSVVSPIGVPVVSIET